MIHVLLIEDNPGDARLIRELLAEAKEAMAFVWADRLSSGLQRLDEGGVDVVLLDLSLPDSKGIDTYTKLRDQAKGLPVILMTGLDDEELGMKAVREGAQDYMVKGTVGAPSLLRSIRFAVERHKKLAAAADQPSRQGAPGRVLGLLGAKGGAGTTTVALNVAAILAQRKKSVIALEMTSFQGSFSFQTRLNPSRNLSHLLGLDAEHITEKELTPCLTVLPSGVKAIFATQRPDEFKEVQPAQAAAIIRCAAGMADYVIVDLPSHLGSVNQAAVCGCDFVLLVVERGEASAAAGKQAVQVLRHWGVGESSVAAAIVVKDGMAGFTAMSELENRLGCPIVGVVPPAAELCTTSSRLGTPIALLEPDSIAAANLNNLTDKLAGAGILQSEFVR